MRRQSSYDPREDETRSDGDSSDDGAATDLAAARLSSGVLARDRKDPGEEQGALRLATQDLGMLGLRLTWATVEIRSLASPAGSAADSPKKVCFSVPVSAASTGEAVEKQVASMLQLPQVRQPAAD